MTPEDSFVSVIGRLRQGDDEAAARVFHRFTRRLVALARLHIETRLRPKVDPEDVLQSVWKSFFLRQNAGNFAIENWDGMWALLAVITVRKCGRVNRYFRSAGRTAEISIAPTDDDSAIVCQALATDPSPEEVGMLTEIVEGMLRDLHERDREVFTLSLQGHSADEVSAQLQRPLRSVYRSLTRIRERLESM